MEKSLLIRIPHNGPIFPKGTVIGPLDAPYKESLAVVGQLLVQNYPVIQVLEDGKERKLTLQNFDKPAVADKVEEVSSERVNEPEGSGLTVKQSGEQQGGQQLSKKEHKRQEEEARRAKELEKKSLVPDEMDEK